MLNQSVARRTEEPSGDVSMSAGPGDDQLRALGITQQDVPGVARGDDPPDGDLRELLLPAGQPFLQQHRLLVLTRRTRQLFPCRFDVVEIGWYIT